MEIWPLVLALAAAGAIAGLVAGMFGVGGGIVIVPALYYAFGAMGVSDATRMHAAVATSLATIVLTSMRSVLAHDKRGAVDREVLKAWVPWIMAGALAGGLVARAVPGAALTVVFALGGVAIAARMAFASEARPVFAGMPQGPARAGLGAGLGLASSWMGIGGGMFGVLLMTMAGRPIHQAVGTSAGFGAAIGLPGALAFIVAGLGVPDRPEYSLGYVSVPGFILISALTVSMAPLGARLAHGLSRKTLSRLFAAGVVVVAAQMLIESVAKL